MKKNISSCQCERLDVINISARFIFLASCILVSGCDTARVITHSIMDGCGTGTVYLNSWFANVPDSSVSYDPIGGYQFTYWVDDANNVCHGTPGINGRPGMAVIKAYKFKANELATNNASVTMEQLKDFQEIPVSYNNYVGSGLHFVQFFNKLARERSTGQAIKFPGLNGTVSIPNVIVIENMSCTAPIVMRVNGVDSASPLPNLQNIDPNAQDPDKCKVRAMPRDRTMSEQDRKLYDAANFSFGTKIYEVP